VVIHAGIIGKDEAGFEEIVVGAVIDCDVPVVWISALSPKWMEVSYVGELMGEDGLEMKRGVGLVAFRIKPDVGAIGDGHWYGDASTWNVGGFFEPT
jgi:hypothetical protein